MIIPRLNLILSKKRKTILIKEKNYHSRNKVIKTSADISMLVNKIFRLSEQAEEKLVLICMDIRCRPIGAFEVSHGNVGASFICIREIFIRALLNGAVFIAVAHNHPSGIPSPSEMDWQSFLRLKDAGELIGIPVIDQLIIGNGVYLSMQKRFEDSKTMMSKADRLKNYSNLYPHDSNRIPESTL